MSHPQPHEELKIEGNSWHHPIASFYGRAKCQVVLWGKELSEIKTQPLWVPNLLAVVFTLQPASRLPIAGLHLSFWWVHVWQGLRLFVFNSLMILVASSRTTFWERLGLGKETGKSWSWFSKQNFKIFFVFVLLWWYWELNLDPSHWATSNSRRLGLQPCTTTLSLR